MLLNGHGFIPGNPRTREICGRREVIDRRGPAVEFTEGIGAPCRGYEFREEDGERYHLYVIELFERVHQRKLVRRLLPYHFARGLAVEAAGGAMNWIAFAMTRCFPKHKRSPFVPLTEFSATEVAVPWVHKKVLPAPEVNAHAPLAPEIQVKISKQICSFTYVQILRNIPALRNLSPPVPVLISVPEPWTSLWFNLKWTSECRKCAGRNANRRKRRRHRHQRHP